LGLHFEISEPLNPIHAGCANPQHPQKLWTAGNCAIKGLFHPSDLPNKGPYCNKKPHEPAAITPELVASHGLKPDEYERISQADRAGAEFHGTRDFLGDVERTLFVQVVTAASAWPADQGAMGDPGPGENAGVIDIGDGQAVVFKNGEP